MYLTLTRQVVRLLVHTVRTSNTAFGKFPYCKMPVPEENAVHCLTMLDVLVADHAHMLTPTAPFRGDVLGRLTPFMAQLVKLRLIRVCKQYARAIKPLLVGAMSRTACSPDREACTSCLK
jgi:hypothetical protein